MAKKFLVPIDLNQLELQNVRLQNLASAPASPVVGQVYFNTTTDKAMVWDGTDWIPWEVGATVQPAAATPLMDGTAAVGTSLLYAREDHVHPSDTSKVDTTTTVNGHALSSNVTVTASDIGVEAGAQVNQNAFSTVVANGTTIASDSPTDTLNISQGNGIKITGDAGTDTVTFALKHSTVYYGTCTTAAGTAAKTAGITDYALNTGNVVYIKFTNGNTYNGVATLNINGTGAKSIATVGTTTTSRYFWKTGELVGFVYDGTNYLMLEQGTADTTYYGVTKLSSSTSSTSETLSATPKAVKAAYDLADGKSTVSYVQNLANGTTIGTITINGTTTTIYAPTPTGQVQADWTEADSTAASYIQNKPTLATVATTGAYGDLTGKPTLGTAAAKGVDNSISAGDTSTDLPTTKAVVDYIETTLGLSDAMRFRGTLGTGGTISSLPATHDIGDTYMIITAGTYAGQACEVGDLIIARTTSGTTSSDWCVAQTNIDGAITSISGTAPISVSGSGTSRTVSHDNSGATAGSYGDSTAQTPAFGGTFKVPYVTVNATGHVTGISAHNVTIPSTAATTSGAGIVQLNDTVTSTSTSQAGTANAVKTAYDKGKDAYDIAYGLAATNGLGAIKVGDTTLSSGSTSVTVSANVLIHSARNKTTGEEVVIDRTAGLSSTTFSIASSVTFDIGITYFAVA